MLGNIVAGTFSAGAPPVTNSYESIATALGTGSSGVVTFSSIPSTYKHLQIRITAFQATGNDVFLKVNSDAGVRGHWLQGNGASATAGSETGTGNGQYFGTDYFNSTNPTVAVVDFLDYGSTTKAKTARWLWGRDSNGSGRIILGSSLFTTTSAITSITFTSANSYTSNSHFALYGIKD
jgi:hypothetical protein